MKKFILAFSCLVFLVFSTTSCTKDKDTLIEKTEIVETDYLETAMGEPKKKRKKR